MTKKEDMLTWLDQMIDTYIGDAYDVAVNWDSRHHQIEILMCLFTENKEELAVVDVCDVAAESVIEFEDSLLLYGGEKQNIDSADYLATFSFNRRQGMEKAKMAAIIMMLREVLDEGQSDLLDFMTDETIEEFELHWPEEEWQRTLQQAQQIYPNTLVRYPKF